MKLYCIVCLLDEIDRQSNLYGPGEGTISIDAIEDDGYFRQVRIHKAVTVYDGQAVCKKHLEIRLRKITHNPVFVSLNDR